MIRGILDPSFLENLDEQNVIREILSMDYCWKYIDYDFRKSSLSSLAALVCDLLWK